MTERSIVVKLRGEISDLVGKLRQADAAIASTAKSAEQTAQRTKAADKQVGDAAKIRAQVRKQAADDEVRSSERSRIAAANAAKQYGQVTSKILANKDSITTASNKLIGFGALVGAGIGIAVKAAADFDEAMSHVAATGADAKSNLDALRQAAIDAGSATAFSATEAAGAIEELEKAGVSSADILSGGLAGSLSLAAAGGLDVADAAAAAASAMNQFGLQGKDVPHIADLLAAAAGSAAGDVSDFTAALDQSGLIADQVGLSIEDATGTLALFAKNGLLGSDAGTSFKTMLQSLTPNSKEAAKAMKDIGLNAYDAQGNFVGITDVAGQLQTGLSKLSKEQQNMALKTIFGSDAVRAATILYKAGAAGLNEMIDATNQQGYAARVAATRMDNLKGDLEGFRGALETTFIQSGSGANEALRSLVQEATRFARALANVNPQVLETGLKVAAVGAGAAVLLGGVGKLVVSLAELRKFFITTGIAAKVFGSQSALAGGKLGALAKGAGAAGIGIAAVFAAMQGIDKLNGFDVSIDKVNDAVDSLSRTGKTVDINKIFSGIQSAGITRSADNIDSISDAFAKLNGLSGPEKLYQWMDGVANTSFEASTQITKNLDAVDESLAQLANNGGGDSAAQAFAKIAEQADSVNYPIEKLLGNFGDYKASLVSQEDALRGQSHALDGVTLSSQDYVDWMSGRVPPAIQAAADATGSATHDYDNLKSSTQQLVDVHNELVASALAAAGALLKSRGDQRGVQAAYDDAAQSLKDYRKELIEKAKADGKGKDAARAYADRQIAAGKALDITTAAGRKNQEALDGIASAAQNLASTQRSQNKSESTVRSGLEASRKQYIRTATDMGMPRKAAVALANSLFNIPKSNLIKVHEDGSKVSKTQVDNLNTAIKNLPKEKRADVRTEWQSAGYDAAVRKLNEIDGKTATTYVRTVESRTVTNTGPAKAAGAGSKSNVKLKASGGLITGSGTGTSDSIPAMLSNGEVVIKAQSVKSIGVDRLLYANSTGQLPHFATGGIVGKVKDITPSQGLISIGRLIATLTTPINDLISATRKFNAAAEASKKASDAVTKPRNNLRAARSGLSAAQTELRRATRAATPSASLQRKLTAAQNAYDRANQAAGGSISKAEQKRLDRLQNKLSRLRDLAEPTGKEQARVEKATKAVESAQNKVNTALETYQKASDHAKAASDNLKAAEEARKQVLEQIADQADQTGAAFAGLYQSASTDAQDWIESMRTGAAELLKFQQTVAQLRAKGLNESTIQQIIGVGQTSGTAAGQALADSILGSGTSGITDLNKAAQALQKAADKLGYTQATPRNGYATGGLLSGVGTGTSDSLNIRASTGEYMVNAKATARNLPLLDAINYGKSQAMIPAYATGGMVGSRIDIRALTSALRDMSFYVENPWTGQYMQARMVTTARQVVQQDTQRARTSV